MSWWSKSLYLQVCSGQDLQKQNLPPPSQPSGKLIYHMVQELVCTRIGHLLLMTLPLVFFCAEAGASQNQASSFNRESQLESAKVNLLPSPLSIGVLQEIGRRCSSKVELA